MNFRDLMYQANQGGSFGCRHGGIVSEGVNAIEFAGASALTGYLLARYEETINKSPVPIPLVAGLALKALAVTMDIKSYGTSAAAPHLHVLANAPLGAFFTLEGMARGFAARKEQLFIAPKGTKAIPGAREVQNDRLWGAPAGGTVNVGYIPQAPEGQWFGEGGVRHFANK
jgi:hypothetical protein